MGLGCYLEVGVSDQLEVFGFGFSIGLCLGLSLVWCLVLGLGLGSWLRC